MSTQVVAAARLVELAARMRVAGHLDDGRRVAARTGQVQRIVTAEGVGIR
jgi:hypothetical protein